MNKQNGLDDEPNNCISGDTIIMGARHNVNVETMYKLFNSKQWARKHGYLDLYSVYKKAGYGKAVSLHEDGRLYENRILDIVYPGKQEVFMIRTKSGYRIKATHSHRFPVGSYDNFLRLRDLVPGDMLFVRNGYDDGVGVPTVQDEIVSIEPYGEEPVYDVVMTGQYHTFAVADGIVTCGYFE